MGSTVKFTVTRRFYTFSSNRPSSLVKKFPFEEVQGPCIHQVPAVPFAYFMNERWSEILNALCIDVDDLAYSLRVVKGTGLSERYWVEEEGYALLEGLAELKIQATLFVPGYVAARYPALVRAMAEGGHEIACHGFSHQTAEQLGPKGFLEDAAAGKKELEGVIGRAVVIFKAPDWGIKEKTPWAYDQLIAAGFRIDHSAHPSLLKALGRRPDDGTPFLYHGVLSVIPVTTVSFFGKTYPFNGGMYTAYIPMTWQIRFFRQLNRQGIPFNYYCHPYEFHPCGTNRKPWRYGSIRASLYGLHFGKYERYIRTLGRTFRLGPLSRAYERFLKHLASTEGTGH